MPRSRSKPAKPKNPWRDLASVVLLAPLYAVPFGIFFGLLYGKKAGDFIGAYIASLIFAFVINLCVWSTNWFVRPIVLPDVPSPSPSRSILRTLLYGGSAVFGVIVTAVVLHFTIAPAILGSARDAAIVGMFTLLFLMVITGAILATRFYRDSIERVRSDQELALARRIQRSFLPSTFPKLPGLDVHAVNVSSKQVSGDFYDVVPGVDADTWVAIADVAGKGVPAALLSSMLQASLRTQAEDGGSVSSVMTKINRLAWRSTTPEQFATFFLGRIDGRKLRLTYSNAGHNPPVLMRGACPRLLDRGGTIVGILEDTAYEEESIDLAPGDRVILYTDGISEAENARREMYGEERLYAVVGSLASDLESSAVTQAILDDVAAFLAGEDPGDDMTVMAIAVRELG